jgi:hypothetical protein
MKKINFKSKKFLYAMVIIILAVGFFFQSQLGESDIDEVETVTEQKG